MKESKYTYENALDLSNHNGTVMTLTEYLNQEDAVYMPRVLLEESEYELLMRTEDEKYFYLHVRVPSVNFKYIVQYFKTHTEPHWKRLYTTNQDWEILKNSCFFIKVPV
jgi:hypothetical protein